MLGVRVIALAAVIVIAGCASLDSASVQKVSIESTPAGAAVTLPDGQSCTTPCAVRAKAYEPLRVTFRKPGCLTQTQLVMPEPLKSGASDTRWRGGGQHANGALGPNPLYARLRCDDAPTVGVNQAVSAS